MIKVLLTAGQGVDTDDMSLRFHNQQVRVGLANTDLNNHIMVGMTPEGVITIKAKEKMTDFTTPMTTVFEGTVEDLIARIAQ